MSDIENFKEFINKQIEETTEKLNIFPNDEEYYYRGCCYQIGGYHDKALSDFNKIIKKDKEIYFCMGVSYALSGQIEMAEDSYKKVINEDESIEPAYRNIAIIYLAQKKYSEAEEYLYKAEKLNPDFYGIYALKGKMYLGLKDYIKAKKYFNDAIIKFEHFQKENMLYTSEKGAFLTLIRENLFPNKNKNIFNKNKNVLNMNKNVFNTDVENISTYIIEEKNLTKKQKDIIITLIIRIFILLEELKANVNDCNFSHYTRTSLLKDILKKDNSSKFRLNNSIYMNDPEEGQIFKKLLKKKNKNLEKIFESSNNDESYAYLSCFCKNDKNDELPMWIHYADKGDGISFVLNGNFFEAYNLYEVQYIDFENFDIEDTKEELIEKLKSMQSKKKYNEITQLIEKLEKERKIKKNLKKISNILNNNIFIKSKNETFIEFTNILINYVAYLFKDKAYEYENEVRIIEFRLPESTEIQLTDKDIVPKLYLEINGINKENCDKIIVGPKANYEEISTYVKYVGIKKVVRSKIKYK